MKLLSVVLALVLAGCGSSGPSREPERAAPKPILDFVDGWPFEIRTEVERVKAARGRARVQLQAALYNTGDVAVRTRWPLAFEWEIRKWPNESAPLYRYAWQRDTTWTLVDNQVIHVIMEAPSEITVGPGERHPGVRHGRPGELDFEPGTYEVAVQVPSYGTRGGFVLAIERFVLDIAEDLTLNLLRE